ncbi:dTDP-4-dehydrorhamnose 3,5-epimerase [Thermodesulfobacteriota bacterium]
MNFSQDPILPEVQIIESKIFKDDRGFFIEMYHKEKFEKAGIIGPFVQDNRSRSRQGTLRGLHYQIGRPQGKLIWVLAGEIFDVAMDIRKNSSTFGKWTGHILSDENKKGLFIPPDFAHGFCVLSKDAEIFYKCTDLYYPDHERCIKWDDPDLAIDWPIKSPVLSEKDANGPLLKDAELPV